MCKNYLFTKIELINIGRILYTGYTKEYTIYRFASIFMTISNKMLALWFKYIS